MIRLFGALAFALYMAGSATACETNRFPWLDCAGNLLAAAPGRQVTASIDANGNRAAYAGAVERAAWSAGVPSAIAHAVVRIESNYNPRVRGAAGEWGIGQIKCQTARGVGFAGACHALADAATNLNYAMAYLRQAIDKGGAGCAGVSLYNTGVAARPRCTAYGRRVMALASRS